LGYYKILPSPPPISPLEAAAKSCEVYLHNVPAEGGDDIDRIGRYSNGTVKCCAAAIRAIKEQL
jgi:hypothetical protein